MLKKTLVFAMSCSALAVGCAMQQDNTQEIIENLTKAGFRHDDIEVQGDIVIVGRDAVVSLAASREMLNPGDSSAVVAGRGEFLDWRQGEIGEEPIADLQLVVLDRQREMLVDGVGPGEGEESFLELGERREMASALDLELAQDVDYRPSCFGWVRPKVEGKLVAEEVEVDVGDAVVALAGEVVRDAVRACVLLGHVLDDGAVLGIGEVTLGLSLLKGLGGGLGVPASHKFASPPAV